MACKEYKHLKFTLSDIDVIQCSGIDHIHDLGKISTTFQKNNIMSFTERGIHSCIDLKHGSHNIKILNLFQTTFSSFEMAKLYKYVNKQNNFFTEKEINKMAIDKHPAAVLHTILHNRPLLYETKLEQTLRLKEHDKQLLLKNQDILEQEQDWLTNKYTDILNNSYSKKAKRDVYVDVFDKKDEYIIDIEGDISKTTNQILEISSVINRKQQEVKHSNDEKEDDNDIKKQYPPGQSLVVIGFNKTKMEPVVIFLNLDATKDFNYDWRNINIWLSVKGNLLTEYNNKFVKLQALEKDYNKSFRFLRTRRTKESKRFLIYSKLEELDQLYDYLIVNYDVKKTTIYRYKLNLYDGNKRTKKITPLTPRTSPEIIRKISSPKKSHKRVVTKPFPPTRPLYYKTDVSTVDSSSESDTEDVPVVPHVYRRKSTPRISQMEKNPPYRSSLTGTLPEFGVLQPVKKSSHSRKSSHARNSKTRKYTFSFKNLFFKK